MGELRLNFCGREHCSRGKSFAVLLCGENLVENLMRITDSYIQVKETFRPGVGASIEAHKVSSSVIRVQFLSFPLLARLKWILIAAPRSERAEA